MRNDDVGAHIASLALSPLNLVLKESRQCIKNVILLQSVANSMADTVCEVQSREIPVFGNRKHET